MVSETVAIRLQAGGTHASRLLSPGHSPFASMLVIQRDEGEAQLQLSLPEIGRDELGEGGVAKLVDVVEDVDGPGEQGSALIPVAREASTDLVSNQYGIVCETRTRRTSAQQSFFVTQRAQRVDEAWSKRQFQMRGPAVGSWFFTAADRHVEQGRVSADTATANSVPLSRAAAGTTPRALGASGGMSMKIRGRLERKS